MAQPQGASRHDDRGQTLLLALVFLTVFALLIGVVLTHVEANLKTTVVVRSRADRSYATDAGIEYAVKRIALDPTACPDSTIAPLPSQTVNGRTVTITCQVTTAQGEGLGASGWAAIVRGNLSKQGGGQAHLSGPMYVRGTISSSGGTIDQKNGSVFQFSSSCPGSLGSGPSSGTLSVTPNPPYSWQCTTAGIPDPPHVLPPVPTRLNPLPKVTGNCTVFYPGKYTSAPALTANNYFVSGVYYFENVGLWGGRNIVGGTPAVAADEPNNLGLAACGPPNADATPGGGGSGSGVEWIFGGTSSFSAGNGDNVELYSRVPGPAEPANVTDRISFLAVPSAGGGYLASAPSGGRVLDTSSGHPGVAIHGMVYAPTTDVSIDGPVGQSVLHNGIVARNLDVKLSQAAPENLISVDTSSTTRRFVVLNATSPYNTTDPACQPTDAGCMTSRALVEIRNNTSPATIVVHSWRTG